MCELFGYSGKSSRKLNAELAEFFSHSVDNPDGWGLASWEAGRHSVHKEAVPAASSDTVRQLLQAPFVRRQVLAHIRLATIGYDEYDNSHPFWGKDRTGRMWTLIHNGTIFEGDVLDRYSWSQRGSTDSERVFLYLIDRINDAVRTQGRLLAPEERFRVVEDMIRELAPHNKLNILLFDGQLMYAHTNFHDSLYRKTTEEGVLFSTKPLDDAGWSLLPPATLLAFADGRQVLEGKCHGFEYVPDEESIKALYLAYSGL